MDINKVTEVMFARIPADVTGLLLVKVAGDATHEEYVAMQKCMSNVIKDAGLHCTVAVLAERDGIEFTLQHLTDDALRDIGFQRIYSEFT